VSSKHPPVRRKSRLGYFFQLSNRALPLLKFITDVPAHRASS
jgi:hypothetical protein